MLSACGAQLGPRWAACPIPTSFRIHSVCRITKLPLKSLVSRLFALLSCFFALSLSLSFSLFFLLRVFFSFLLSSFCSLLSSLLSLPSLSLYLSLSRLVFLYFCQSFSFTVYPIWDVYIYVPMYRYLAYLSAFRLTACVRVYIISNLRRR